MSLINFRNGFFLALGFSLGYMKAVHDNEKIVDLLDDLKNDPEVRDSLRELKDGFKEAIARDKDENGVKPSSQYPANGTDLPVERKTEINLSTPENPVTLTKAEIDAMNLNHVKVGVGSGRFLLGEDVAASPEDHERYKELIAEQPTRWQADELDEPDETTP